MKPIYDYSYLVRSITGLVVLLFLVKAPLALAQTMHTVVNSDDAGPGSLRQAVADAAPGDEIVFSEQLIGQTISLTTGPITIDEDLTITGLGADSLAISGGNASRVFEFLAGVSATISGLTVTGGFAGQAGGGIWTGQGASLTVDRATITGNLAVDNGGGIYNSSGAFTRILNSRISDNEAAGELSPNGGGVYNASGEVRIENSVITGNKSTRGAGIWNAGASVMKIDNSTISGNIASGEGGGIYNNNKLTIANSTISGNQADFEGGGIRNRGSDTLSVINSTISGNSAGRVGGLLNDGFGATIVRNTTVYGNKSDLSGAGIWNNEQAKFLLYSTIVAFNLVDDTLHSDIVDLGAIGSGIVSEGFNLIGNGDASADVNGSKFFEPLTSDQVGFSFVPRDPLLGPLADRGGPTQTHAPLRGSPVIDRGDCRKTGLAFDQAGAPRVVDVPGSGFANTGDGCDIGAVEASISLATPIEEASEHVSLESALEPAFPNPFTHRTSFNVTLSREQEVTISLHNILGQRVRMLHSGVLPANVVYKFGIDAAGLASGPYIISISGDGFAASRQVLIVK